MPFVDLNNPNQNDDNQQNGNGVNQSNASSKPPVMKSVAIENPPEPNKNEKSGENNKQMEEKKKQDENMTDEHTLMRDVPNLANGNAMVDESGVKEIKGPPIGERADVKQNNSNNNQDQTQNTNNNNLGNNVKMDDQNNAMNNNQSPAPVAQVPPMNLNQVQQPQPAVSVQQPINNQQQNNNTQVSNNNVQPVQPNNVPIVPEPTNQGLPPLPKLDNSVPMGEKAQVPAPPQQPNDFNLQGSAKGQEQVVAEIFKKADQTIAQTEEKQNTANTPMPKLETADEKFINANATLNDLLSLTEKRDASDLHLAVDYPPILRVDGKLINLGGTPLTDERIQQLFDQILTQAQKEQLEKDLDIDFSHTHTTGSRFRINIFHKKGSLAGAFRLIPSRIRSIAELNLPSILYDLVSIPQGLIILAGPTGSGKSTTIASMIQEVNLSQPKHIITIEDPIEYIFPKGTALINQREIGTDATSFKRALREVLREDPDVVLVGEMRDYEAISMTITTAETGHLVFSTLHTNSASQTVDRMIDVFPDAQQAQVRAQLANVISAVLSQRLVPVKGGGRKAVLEIMIATPAIRNAIREGKTYQIDNMIQTNAEIGMITLEKSLIELIRAGEITLEEAQTYTTKPEELISLMKNN